VLLAHCDRQSLGGACNSLGNDCESPLVCTPLNGHSNLGICCMPNVQCGASSVGLMLNQDGSTATPTPDAAADGSPADSPSGASEAGEAAAGDAAADAGPDGADGASSEAGAVDARAEGSVANEASSGEGGEGGPSDAGDGGG
jgi:hypothetical protein